MLDQHNEDTAHALSLMETALELLDRSNFTADAAAHLDLAINRLKERLDSSKVPMGD
jgi:hypothetical protein